MGALSPGIEPPADVAAGTSVSRPARLGIVLVVAAVAAFTLPPLLAWRQSAERRTRSLSNARRIATGALLYAQDWDGRLMPIAEQLPGGKWQTWPDSLRAYVGDTSFENPSNATSAATHHPSAGYAVRSSYALNHRFWNTFSPGPFPLDDLELSEQTVMIIEAGPFWSLPTRRGARDTDANAVLDYGDTTDRWRGLTLYPSTHDGRTAAVAADGHGLILTVEHYDGSKRHDPLYGRIGSGIYNWNGGHPNGETDRPPRE